LNIKILPVNVLAPVLPPNPPNPGLAREICLLVITLGTTIIYSLLYFLGTSTGTSLFGAKPVGFGATTSAPSFSLGGTTGGLFGPTSSLAKPGVEVRYQ
jgi:hypothetical protein